MHQISHLMFVLFKSARNHLRPSASNKVDHIAVMLLTLFVIDSSSIPRIVYCPPSTTEVAPRKLKGVAKERQYTMHLQTNIYTFTGFRINLMHL